MTMFASIACREETSMQESRSLSRRTALAGLSASSLGLFFGAHAAALPNKETGSAPVIPARSPADHPLTGLWLSLVRSEERREGTRGHPGCRALSVQLSGVT